MTLSCTRIRLVALAVVLVMAAVSCGDAGTGEEAAPAVTDVPSESGDGEPDAEPTVAPTQPVASPSGQDGDGDAPPASGENADSDSDGDGGGGNGAPSLTPVSDLAGVGVNGRAYLRADRQRVVIEVDVQEGATIDEDALGHLAATLRSVSATGEVSTVTGGSFASDRTDWSRDDLRAAAEANRDTYSDETTAAMYLLVVRGGFTRDGETTSAIGVAYNGSEMAVFPDRWSDLTGTLLGSSAQVARAVLVHELGHLLGLVNLTYESELDHEDPEHPHHSSNRDSVMFWAIETTAIGQVFSGPPPDTFDDADRADLEGLRSGRL